MRSGSILVFTRFTRELEGCRDTCIAPRTQEYLTNMAHRNTQAIGSREVARGQNGGGGGETLQEERSGLPRSEAGGAAARVRNISLCIVLTFVRVGCKKKELGRGGSRARGGALEEQQQ